MDKQKADKMVIQCICGKRVILKLVGGQYQNLYQGECQKCGRKWSLEEQSELFREIENK